MKFGRNLPRNQVPEWANHYIKYKPLKKLIKSAAEIVKHGESADTAGTLIKPFARGKSQNTNILQSSSSP